MKDNGKNIRSSFLYHYTHLDTVIDFIIPNLKLKAGTFTNSNDPRETESFGFGTINDEAPNYQYLDEYDEEQKNISQAVRKSIRYLCFCQDYQFENEWWNGYNMPRMWHQYSDKHAGVCLEIDENSFIDENRTFLSKLNVYFEDIHYSNEVDDLTFNLIQWRAQNDNYIQTFWTENYRKLFLKKASDWVSENEKRIVIIGEEQEIYFSIKNSLKRIIIGFKVNEDNLKRLVKTCPDIKIAKVVFNEERIKAMTFVDSYIDKLKSSSS